MKKYQICTLAIIILTFVSFCWAQSDRDRFVGTWRLISIEDPSPTASKPDRDPAGYIMYDSTGHMAVQIIRNPNRPKFASDNLAEGRPEEIRAAFVGYGAYYGTYEVNEKEGIVIHHLEGALFPNEIGTDNIRYYEFSGDRVILIVPQIVGGKILPKSPTARRLIWERVK